MSQPPGSVPDPNSNDDQVYQADVNDPNPYQSSVAASGQSFPQNAEGDSTGGVIPYKNVPALIGYYMGVFSLIPCVGPPFGLIAIVLGILGLFKKKKMPQAKGSAHAVVAIVLGTFSLAYHGGIFLWMSLDAM